MQHSARTVRPAILGGAAALPAPVLSTLARVPDRATFDGLVDGVFAARWFTNQGELVERLEALLAERMGIDFVAAAVNGTVGLLLALRALELEGEVITTPFTFPATAHGISWNGLAPVFADVDPRTYNLDPAHVESLITPDTCAILPVHVFGNPCDVRAYEAIAERHGLKIVYDAAHAFDVSIDGRGIATYGDLSVFSFHATKLFHTCEGGAVVGSDAGLAASIRLLRNFGIVDAEQVSGIGINAKLSEVHAATGLALLGSTDEEIARRRACTAAYDRILDELPGVLRQERHPGASENGAYLPIEIDPVTFGLTRDELHAALERENVFARKYFHPLCTKNSCYSELPSAAPERLPHATRLAGRILCLPMYGELGTEAAERIAAAIARLHAAAPQVREALAVAAG